jgi:hypothetical protein
MGCPLRRSRQKLNCATKFCNLEHALFVAQERLEKAEQKLRKIEDIMNTPERPVQHTPDSALGNYSEGHGGGGRGGGT